MKKENDENHKSVDCGKCAVCGNFGSYIKSMINKNKTLKNKKLKQSLIC